MHYLTRRLSPYRYLIQTWTGRILIVNTVVFIVITLLSGDLFNPSAGLLVALGAKDPLSIGLGQWWRFITPLFLHIGLLHFLLNSAALRFIGRIVEPLMGGFWFLLTYFLSGIAGNIFSSLSSVAIGAGASGAIFGLIGVGVVMEVLAENRRLTQLKTRPYYDEQRGVLDVGPEARAPQSVKRRLIPGPFSFMAVLNLALAVVLNFFLSLSAGMNIGIDNAAHCGGLVTGCLLGLGFLFSKPNPLVRASKIKSFCLTLAAVLGLLGLGFLASQSSRITELYGAEARASKDFWPAVANYSRALELSPEDPELRLARATLLLRAGKYEDEALEDLRVALTDQKLRAQVEQLASELRQNAKQQTADRLQKLLSATPITP